MWDTNFFHWEFDGIVATYGYCYAPIEYIGIEEVAMDALVLGNCLYDKVSDPSKSDLRKRTCRAEKHLSAQTSYSGMFSGV
jgi:hypothetical protein